MGNDPERPISLMPVLESARCRGEPPAMGAERPSHGGGRTGPCRPRRQAPGIVTERRRPRSGLRGAGRGEAAPGGIEPGDRSEGPGGRPTLPTGEADDGGPSSATMEDAPQATGFGEFWTRAATIETVVASNVGSGRRGGSHRSGGGERSATAKPFTERRADALRNEALPVERKDRRASGDGAPAPSRPRGRGGWRDAGWRRRERARRRRVSGAPSPSRTLSVDVRLWQRSKRKADRSRKRTTGSGRRSERRLTRRCS